MATLGSVNFNRGNLNIAGLKTKVYWALHSDVQTFPPVPDNSGAFDVNATIDTAYVMKTGKRFWELYITQEKGKAEFKLVGERDGKSFETILSGNYPDLDATVMGFLRATANENIAIIWPDAKGRLWTHGYDPDLPVEVTTADGTTGEKTSDGKGLMISFRGIGDIAMLYDAAVPLTPAT